MQAKSDGKRVVGIDSSSHSLAYSVFYTDSSGVELLDCGKFKFQSKEMDGRIAGAINGINHIFNIHDGIDEVVIEQTVYIQNPQTSRILSYIVGAAWATARSHCERVRDVPVQTWKSYIGYRNVTRAEKAEWAKELGKVEANKKAAFERKERTARIMRKMFEGAREVDDDDIMDAIAIGYWACRNGGEE